MYFVQLPDNLAAWTYETVLAVVRLIEYEPARLDFKEVLKTTERGDQKRHNENIQKGVVSMANAPGGGYLLFGIRDPRADAQVPVRPPEERIIGIPLGADLRKEVGDKLRAILPPPAFDICVIPLPNDVSRGVLVVEIPESPLRPHMDPSTHVFYTRSAGGNAEPMSQREVRDHMLYSGQRLQQVVLLRLDVHTLRLLRTALRDPDSWFARFDVQAFKVLLAQTCDLLPEDGRLLALLQGIATMASQFNAILDQAQSLWRRARFVPRGMPRSPQRTLDANVQKHLNTFDEWCAQAETLLAERFGPLPITDVWWPPTSADQVLERPTPSVHQPQQSESSERQEGSAGSQKLDANR